MKYLIGLFLTIFCSGFISGQDLDIYKHKKNSNFEIPAIPQEMTYEEFKILSTDLRMQDMMIAVVLPGHVHFKIDEKKTGYYILGARTLGYLGWGYLALTNKSISKIIILDSAGLNNSKNKRDKIIAYSSIAFIISSYLFDWIHGKYMLDNKQNNIRYKYARKKVQLGFNLIQTPRYKYPGLGLTFNF